MILTTFIRQLAGLRDRTELLESLNWDEELTDNFVEELQIMLMAAPPNLDKALFWLKNTPWECFDNQLMPPKVFQTVEILINRTGDQLIKEQEARQRSSIFVSPYSEEDDGWN